MTKSGTTFLTMDSDRKQKLLGSSEISVFFSQGIAKSLY